MKIEEQMWEEFGEIEGRYMQVLLRDIDEKYEGLIGTEILQHHYRLREAASGH